MNGRASRPTSMAIAKGIGGGFPMGACLATDEAAVGMTAGIHGTTFGGNPLAMAVGNAVLDVVLADGFLDEVSRKALLMKQGLASIADEFPEVIEEIRGAGLLLGIKCQVPNTELQRGAARPEAARRAGRRQRHPPAAAADRHRRRDPRGARPHPRRRRGRFGDARRRRELTPEP